MPLFIVGCVGVVITAFAILVGLELAIRQDERALKRRRVRGGYI